MRSMSLAAVAEAVSGQLIGRDTEIAEISTDSRKMPEAALFVALRGERFDAHDFLDQAKNAGAAALMVECQVDLGLPQILVPDCRLALGQLARARISPVLGLMHTAAPHLPLTPSTPSSSRLSRIC